MGMVVRSNIMALNANRQLGMNNSQVSKSLEKLSSGFKINRAGDDASGLAISEKMKAQIKGLETASANSQDGISLVQTAEGALTEVHDMLNRMVELAGKAANGTIDSETDRAALQKEMDSLLDEIDRIAQGTNFNGIQLLDGSLGGAAKLPTVDVSGIASGKATIKNIQGEKAVYEVELSGKQSGDFSSAKLDGVDITWNTDLDTTLKDFVDAYNAEEGKDYVASVSGSKIILTAKNEGAVDTDPAISGVTGVSNVSETTAGVTAGVEVTLETGKNMAAGDKITINGKTYTMAAADDADKAEFKDIAGLQKLLKDDGIILEGTDLNGGSKLTISTKPDAKKDGGLTLQIGDTGDAYNKLTVSIGDMSAAGLGIDGLRGTGIMSQDAAMAALDLVKKGSTSAINTVSSQRAALGAMQNRLEHTINNLDVATENMEAANSRIRDTDMAKEMMEYTKQNVLTQAAQAMLAQANQQPQSILQLLQ